MPGYSNHNLNIGGCAARLKPHPFKTESKIIAVAAALKALAGGPL